MIVRGSTLGKPGIRVARGFVRVGNSSTRSAWLPVTDDVPRGWSSKLWKRLTGRYRLDFGELTYSGGRIRLRATAEPDEGPTRALILLNPAAHVLGWRKIEITAPPEVEILRQGSYGDGMETELLVLAPPGSRITCAVTFVPVEASAGNSGIGPIYTPLPELVAKYELRVDESCAVTQEY